MTKTIDEWAAEKCGVELRQIRCGDESRAYMFKLKGKTYWLKWTIEDPRCREIFRDWWLSKNSKRAVMFTKFGCLYLEPGDDPEDFNVNEEACITAIYEAENGGEE